MGGRTADGGAGLLPPGVSFIRCPGLCGRSPALPFYNFVTNGGALSGRLAGLKTFSNQRRVG